MDESRIAPVEAMEVHGDGAQQAGRLSFDAYGARVNALAWIVEDGNLNCALDAALRFASGVRVVAGRAVELRTDAEHALVRLDNGDTLSASLVVGAGGGRAGGRGRGDI